MDDCKSTTGYAIFVSSNLISWASKKQRSSSQSSTEAEYCAIATTISELMWLQSIWQEIGFLVPYVSVLWCDNLSDTYMTINFVFHQHTKYLEIDWHFVRDLVQKEQLHVRYISSPDQVVDILTKSTTKVFFLHF